MSASEKEPYQVSEREGSTPAPPWFVVWGLPEGRLYIVDGKPAEQWVLEFVGRFSAFQNSAEKVISTYLKASCPRLGEAISRKHLGRLTDEDRWDYVKALTRDVGYQGNLVPSASGAFWRCKRVRDFVSHHTRMDLMRRWGGTSYYYEVPEAWRKPQMPDPLAPETFRDLAAECRWLEAFIDHIAYLSGVHFISAAAHVNAEGKPEPQYLEFISAAAHVNAEGKPEPQYLEIIEPPSLPIPAGIGSDWSETSKASTGRSGSRWLRRPPSASLTGHRSPCGTSSAVDF